MKKRSLSLSLSADDVVCMFGVKQKLKTRVVKKNVNPEWNEDLTLCIADPNTPIKLVSAFSCILL